MARTNLHERKFNSRKDPTLRESKDFQKFTIGKLIGYLALSLILCYMATTLLFNILQTVLVTAKAQGITEVLTPLINGFKSLATYFENTSNYEVARVTKNLTSFVNVLSIIRWGLCIVLWAWTTFYFFRNYFNPISRNNNEHGDDRLALPSEIKKESLAIPDRYESFDGEFGTINSHVFNNKGIDNYRVKNELQPIEKFLKFDDKHLDERLKENINKYIVINLIIIAIILIIVFISIWNMIF